MKINAQAYIRSSSFKMAALFTALLGTCTAILVYLIARYQDSGTAVNEGLLTILAAVMIALMAIVVLTSFFISFFVVSRTNRIARTAEKIMQTGNLAERIVVDSSWDDLSYLSRVLNIFLARNQEQVDGIRRVADNIAHDLRTPLTHVRNNLEECRAAGATPAQVEELLAACDHMLGTFSAVLRISRIENMKQRNFTAIDFAALLADVVELYEPVAEAKEVTFALHLAPVEGQGDRNLLFQVFANLIDNAIKFSPTGGQVMVTLARQADAIEVTLQDQGPGIAKTEQDKVFTRFYRGDASRSTPGSGLGLSLVQAAISLHGGAIRLQNCDPGLQVNVRL